MAEFDLPAVIDYIMNTTKVANLTYIGHSQGTEISFALLSRFPEYQKKVNLAVELAPIAEVTHVEGLMKFLNQINGNKNPDVTKIFYLSEKRLKL